MMTWTEAELHRLVAHFLRVRFPILLALNKVGPFSFLFLFLLRSKLRRYKELSCQAALCGIPDLKVS